MNKTSIVILIIALAVIGFFLWKGSSKPEPVVETPVQALDRETQADSTASIEADLNAINTDLNLEADLGEVNQEIQSL
ncbi:MAG: hypothetical protein QG674_184 [Patescibacteria group bacterium]|jgi:hypothetical protein|nr:hypothetical protein [Patescibacteria group bacterium]